MFAQQNSMTPLQYTSEFLFQAFLIYTCGGIHAEVQPLADRMPKGQNFKSTARKVEAVSTAPAVLRTEDQKCQKIEV